MRPNSTANRLRSNAAYVDRMLDDIVRSDDLSRYIL